MTRLRGGLGHQPRSKYLYNNYEIHTNVGGRQIEQQSTHDAELRDALEAVDK